jgi:hypothetical protein
MVHILIKRADLVSRPFSTHRVDWINIEKKSCGAPLGQSLPGREGAPFQNDNSNELLSGFLWNR